jgi:hypothetical protein
VLVRAAWRYLALLSDDCWCLVVPRVRFCCLVLLALFGRASWFVVVIGAAWRCLALLGGAWWCLVVLVVLGGAWRCSVCGL